MYMSLPSFELSLFRKQFFLERNRWHWCSIG